MLRLTLVLLSTIVGTASSGTTCLDVKQSYKDAECCGSEPGTTATCPTGCTISVTDPLAGKILVYRKEYYDVEWGYTETKETFFKVEEHEGVRSLFLHTMRAERSYCYGNGTENGTECTDYFDRTDLVGYARLHVNDLPSDFNMSAFKDMNDQDRISYFEDYMTQSYTRSNQWAESFLQPSVTKISSDNVLYLRNYWGICVSGSGCDMSWMIEVSQEDMVLFVEQILGTVEKYTSVYNVFLLQTSTNVVVPVLYMRQFYKYRTPSEMFALVQSLNVTIEQKTAVSTIANHFNQEWGNGRLGWAADLDGIGVDEIFQTVITKDYQVYNSVEEASLPSPFGVPKLLNYSTPS